MDFLDFFVRAPYFGQDVPHASLKKTFKLLPKAALTRRAKFPRVLVRRRGEVVDAAVFVFEYGLHGVPTGCYIPADSDGYRTVIAPVASREEAALEAGQLLLRRGALLLVLSYMQPLDSATADGAAQELQDLSAETAEAPEPGSRIRFPAPAGRRVLASQRRVVGRKLALCDTLESTLARMSRNTRHNLRRSMLQAAEHWGAIFHAKAPILLPDLLDLAKESAYGPPDWAVRERFRAARELPGGVLAGVRGGEGRWLAVVGAHREGDMLCLDWQLNRSGLGTLSMATAMRGFLMEAEIGRGTRWMRFESGTTHPLQHAFLPECTHDVLFARRFLPPALIKRLASGIAAGGPLATVLASDALVWSP